MAEKIELQFLGTSAQIPTANQNPTSIFLKFKEENILVDCAEGTQRQLRKVGLNPCKITRILITHWHGDHVLGLPGLLQTLAASDYNKKMVIYGPKGIKKKINDLLSLFKFERNYSLDIQEIIFSKNNSKNIFENEEISIESFPLEHGIPALGYSLVRKGKLRLDKDKIKKAGLEGPILGKLQQGKDVQVEGRKFKAKDMTYLEEANKISIILDTSFRKRFFKYVDKSDLLIAESNFSKDLQDKAKEYNHMTSEQAAEIAKGSNSKKLILTHVSQRYARNKKSILKEAKDIFSNTVLARDFDSFSI